MRDRGADLDGIRGLGLFGSRSLNGDVVGVGRLSWDVNTHVPLDRDAADGCLTANSETKIFLIVLAEDSPSHTEHDRSPEVATTPPPRVVSQTRHRARPGLSPLTS